MNVSGIGCVVLAGDAPRACDPTPYLRLRKNRKFMGLQDDLAVVAAGRALADAGLDCSGGVSLGERAGLYLVVGHIPFEESDIATLLEHSLDDAGAVSMAAFTSAGFASTSPLLTFRCLPNMPGFHVSTSFDLQGPYVTLYPGAGQLYAALEEAQAALAEDRIDLALVMGVADQRNFLVTHHLARVAHPVARERLGDAAGCLVLERPERARDRGHAARAELVAQEQRYAPFDPFATGHAERQHLMVGDDLMEGVAEVGAASLPCLLAQAIAERRTGAAVHHLTSRDGVVAESRWRLAGGAA